nr:hypothetical protein [uncultured bacterium]
MRNLYTNSLEADIRQACKAAGASEPERNRDGILETTLADGETTVVIVPDEALRLVFKQDGTLTGSVALKGHMANPVWIALILENANI